VTLLLLDIGPIELLLVIAAAVMLFGGDLPDVARRAGQALGRLRATAQDLARHIDAPPDLTRLPEERDDRATEAAPRAPDEERDGSSGVNVDQQHPGTPEHGSAPDRAAPPEDDIDPQHARPPERPPAG
jgi:Sec-independent protein translocase protein TatA